jgi:amidase
MADALWRWNAVELVRAIRTRRISSREAVASALARLDEVNPRINAVVDVLGEVALATADRADAAVKRGEPLGILHGVPVTVKINVDYAGRATTNGVVAFKDIIAHDDSVPVANLLKSGAIIIGRTNVPAFSSRYFTDNALHGRTLNPWDPQRTPGGSSGGAAAAVAAGIGAIAHGNDRAGSIRYPAYACGVFGMRSSFGRIPDFNPGTAEERGLSSQLTNVQGPLARSIDDLRLGLAALQAGDPRDPWWTPIPFGTANVPRPGLVAMFAGLPETTVDPAVLDNLRKAAGWLEDAGYKVEEAAPPHFAEAARLFWTLLMTEERAASTRESASSTRAIELFGDDAVRRARAATRAYSSDLDFEGYIRALARRTAILRDWTLFFARYPLLLMPVSWERPFPIDFDQQGNDAMRRMLDAHHPMLAVSIMGVPGLAAPTGFDQNVPLGVQLVAARFQEETCLAAGDILEARAGMATPTDPHF